MGEERLDEDREIPSRRRGRDRTGGLGEGQPAVAALP